MMEYRCEFLERLERTPASVSYRFKTPAKLIYAAGQFMMVDLGEGLAHPLSMSDCPEETGFIEFTKRMTGSPYCQRLESLKPGEKITVKGPYGQFSCDESSRYIVMLAGGIGITPIRSILKSREKTPDEQCRIVLVYGSLNREDIAFREELEHIKLPGYRLVHVLSDTTGVKGACQGFVTAELIMRKIPEYREATYMISGPPVMVEAVKKALGAMDILAGRIRTDVFMGYDE